MARHIRRAPLACAATVVPRRHRHGRWNHHRVGARFIAPYAVTWWGGVENRARQTSCTLLHKAPRKGALFYGSASVALAQPCGQDARVPGWARRAAAEKTNDCGGNGVGAARGVVCVPAWATRLPPVGLPTPAWLRSARRGVRCGDIFCLYRIASSCCAARTPWWQASSNME